MFSFQGTSLSFLSLRDSMKSLFRETSVNLLSLVEISGIEPLTSCLQGRRSPSWAKPPYLLYEVVGQGLAFLWKSQVACNSPPDCCQEPPFESILACSPFELNCLGLDSYLAFLEVVGQNGLEPSTSRLSVVCSSQLSYWPISTSHFLGTSLMYPLNWITQIRSNTLYWP